MSITKRLLMPVADVLSFFISNDSPPRHDSCPGQPVVANMESGRDNHAQYHIICPECREEWTGDYSEVPRAVF